MTTTQATAQSMTLHGRTALVTGGGRNIGRAIVHALADAGAGVVVGYATDRATAQSVADEVVDNGGTARPARIDVTDVSGMQEEVRWLARSGAPVDILVSNAAIRPQRPHSEITPDEWDLVHGTNVRGPFFLAQTVLPSMRSRGWGRIVMIGGIDAYKGTLLRAHVVASKLGLVGVTRALANEVARSGVTVNALVPGLIDTERYGYVSADIERARSEALDRVPMGRLGRTQEVAATCAFLASDGAAYITGQEIFVTGGAHPLVRQPGREAFA